MYTNPNSWLSFPDMMPEMNVAIFVTVREALIRAEVNVLKVVAQWKDGRNLGL